MEGTGSYSEAHEDVHKHTHLDFVHSCALVFMPLLLKYCKVIAGCVRNRFSRRFYRCCCDCSLCTGACMLHAGVRKRHRCVLQGL